MPPIPERFSGAISQLATLQNDPNNRNKIGIEQPKSPIELKLKLSSLHTINTIENIKGMSKKHIDPEIRGRTFNIDEIKGRMINSSRSKTPNQI